MKRKQGIAARDALITSCRGPAVQHVAAPGSWTEDLGAGSYGQEATSLSLVCLYPTWQISFGKIAIFRGP